MLAAQVPAIEVNSSAPTELFDIGGRPTPFRELLSPDQIQHRVQAMAEDLAVYGHEVGGLHLVTVLEGAQPFSTDLQAALPSSLPITTDSVRVSSYEGERSTGSLVYLKDFGEPLEGRHVVFAEDILESGLTLEGLARGARERGAASVSVATLLRKPSEQQHDPRADRLYVGFDIPPEFVIGYGLDYEGQYRDDPRVLAKAS
jgi:hypoxanthine phosphoribosyltransferase